MKSNRTPSTGRWHTLATLGFAAFILAAPCFSWAQQSKASIVFFSCSDDASFKAETARLSQQGVRLLHIFPPGAAIVEVPAGGTSKLVSGRAVSALRQEAVSADDMKALDGHQRLVAMAWNKAFFGTTPVADMDGAPVTAEPPSDDALEVPISDRGPMMTESLGCSIDSPSKMVSEYMLGSISINVILPQSNGAIDPSTEAWDSSREAQVLAGVVAGTQWLIERGPSSPGAALSFTYHLYSGRTDSRAATSYEPIFRSADPVHEPGAGEGLWTNEILNAFGYAGMADRWTKARAFDDDTRKADGTNWASTVFVADSLNDADGRFADNRFSYTWQPGSHIVMTYDNSGWGISRMGSVYAHELCHAFWARDEYAGSGCSCGQTSGYLAGDNGNCAATCSSSLSTCVMRSADLTGDAGVVCSHTAHQIGWADDDANGVPDALQATPLAQFDAPVVQGGQVVITGSASVQAAPNRNPCSQTYTCALTIARLAGVEIRIDGGLWQAAASTIGVFGEATGTFTFVADGIQPGTHTVDARATDSLGQIQGVPYTATVTVEGSIAPPPIPNGALAGKTAGTKSPGAHSAEIVSINDVVVTWEASCPAAQTNLIWGYGSGLPNAPGGTYALSGSACNMGSTGAYGWSTSPDPSSDSSRLVWWVIVAADGNGTEGSWGHDSMSNERNGMNASGLCGNSAKNTDNPGC